MIRKERILKGVNMIVGKNISEKIRKEQQEKSYASINHAMRIVKESKIAPYVKKMLLYGSCVRNEQTYGSDVDLFLELSQNFPSTLRREAIKLKSDVMPDEKELPDVDLKIVIGQGWKESSLKYYENVKKEGVNIWKN